MNLFGAFQKAAIIRSLQADTTQVFNSHKLILFLFDMNSDEIPLLSSFLPPLAESSRRIYLLRHGETDWNKQGKIQGGGYDIPLNENGRLQAMAVAKTMENIPLTVIASSTLSRSKETADILWKQHNACHRVLDAGLKEMGFGEFEGLAVHSETLDPEVRKRFKTIGREVNKNVKVSFPGGESTTQVEERSTGALFKVLNDYPEEKHIALVGHGRMNKVLIASIAYDDVNKFFTIKQSNTAINVLDVDTDGKWTIQSLNYLEHVKDNVITR
eukprot:scaffold2353_cov134-Cylindrotheca_fusiformis.AAC.12